MSFWTALAKVLPVEFTAVSTDVEAAAKAIQAKADADIASLRKSHVVTAAVSSVDQRLAAFKTLVADYENKLAAERKAVQVSAPTVSTPPVAGATGATGAASA